MRCVCFAPLVVLQLQVFQVLFDPVYKIGFIMARGLDVAIALSGD
jgi:hypothetical protein